MPYLIDASALWYLLRNVDALEFWSDRITTQPLRICEPTRTEFLYSATSPAHRDELEGDLSLLCEPASVPKSAWRWVENAQYKLTQHGQHRSAGVIDLLLCATAVHHGLTVLRVDDDFATVAKVMTEVDQRDIRRR
ncbi:Predicted nucleic acid-binding protein, contains PIN domain [Nonomuraea solani]|uniref:Ribonuclease VapC n=1 Tax=Nonomuraea solani TaxID=1144553 RepID=A0A1H6CP22_9ACTN|nr:PIN domain-containing protein [Nonomuraea solani]SEG74443.1 Predicted nucleic acid-binding protein, contains PIN domain [Nonomuraea solani]